MSYDYLIVGAGFAGSVCARQLADAGKRVLIIDKRDHIGGNAYDYVNEHGVRIHKYGPHIFHTNSDAVFNYLSRFTEWRPYEHRVLASVQGKLVPFPINLDTIAALYGVEFDEADMRAWLAAEVAKSWPEGREVVTAEDQCLSTIGRDLYETFFKGYTTKMWGVTPDKLDKSVTARIPIRFNHDDRYFTDKHQAMPRDGYTALFERMLEHPNIDVRLGDRAPSVEERIHTTLDLPSAHHTIWTGAIDRYYFLTDLQPGFPGFLPYRSLEFTQRLDGGTHPPTVATVNFPDGGDITRGTDMGILTDTRSPLRTTIMLESPVAEGEPFYPIPASANRALYKRYEALADKEPDITFLGRLGSYQYLNMDQVVGQALAVSARLLGQTPLSVNAAG